MARAHKLHPVFVSLLDLAANIAQLSCTCARLVRNSPKAQGLYLKATSHILRDLLLLEQASEGADGDHSLSSDPPPSLDEQTILNCYNGLSSLYAGLAPHGDVTGLVYPLNERE
ncbi:hypothetical protein BDV06DRAFT_164160 [Aspergillus oleicola]